MGKARVFFFMLAFGLSLFMGKEANGEAKLRVGAARLDITPAADPANPPSGKYEHEHLYVRTIVLDDSSQRAALIGADQGGLSEAVWQSASKQVATELNCPVEVVTQSPFTWITQCIR